MQVPTLKNYEELSEYIANYAAVSIKNNPGLLLYISSGSTPVFTCELLVKKMKAKQIDYFKITVPRLNEWVGFTPANTGSCYYIFNTPNRHNKGITIGPGHLMNANKIFLMANRVKKAEVIKTTIEGPVTERFPANIIRQHKDGYVLIDDEAVSLLNK